MDWRAARLASVRYCTSRRNDLSAHSSAGSRGLVSSVSGAASDLVGPQLAVHPNRLGRLAAGPLLRGPVAVTEGGGAHPGAERLLVPPPGHHQPGGPLVGRLEQLEPLEPVLTVHRARPRGEPPRQLVAAIRGHRNRVDLDNRHTFTLRLPGAFAVLRPRLARMPPHDHEASSRYTIDFFTR